MSFSFSCDGDDDGDVVIDDDDDVLLWVHKWNYSCSGGGGCQVTEIPYLVFPVRWPWRLGFKWVPSPLFLLLWLNLQFDVINWFFVDQLDASVSDWSLLDGLSFGSPIAAVGSNRVVSGLLLLNV